MNEDEETATEIDSFRSVSSAAGHFSSSTVQFTGMKRHINELLALLWNFLCSPHYFSWQPFLNRIRRRIFTSNVLATSSRRWIAGGHNVLDNKTQSISCRSLLSFEFPSLFLSFLFFLVFWWPPLHTWNVSFQVPWMFVPRQLGAARWV